MDYYIVGISCPDFRAGGPSPASWSRTPFSTRPGRVSRACRALTVTHRLAETHKETAKDPEHILSSIKFAKCDLQPHTSRIPIRRVGSTDTPLSQTSPGGTAVSPTGKVWKLLRPDLNRHLSLPGISDKDGAMQLNSKKSPNGYKSIIEVTPEVDGTLQQAVTSEAVTLCDTATLCGET